MKIKIITFFSAACIAFALTGCAQSTWLYRVNIQQGNIITSELAKQIHVGMSRDAVSDLLGPPILIDAFNDNRWTYVYTFKSTRGKIRSIERKMVLYFRNGKVSSISTKNIP